MKTNIGSFDAGARFLLGCGILFMGTNGLGPWALLGLVPIATAACAICPLYWLFHIDTASWEEAHEHRHDKEPRF